MARQQEEVDWDRLDKRKFFMLGAGMFSGVTTLLYPLTVIKTKQMALPGVGGGFQGTKQTAATIYRQEGPPGFYRGFTTVICGTIPARVVYLTTLEYTKAQVVKAAGGLNLTEPAMAGLSNFVAGAVASMTVQMVTVPIDVISQKQMVHGDETVTAQQQHRRASGAAASASKPAATAAAGSTAQPAGQPTATATPAGAVRSAGEASTSGPGRPAGPTPGASGTAPRAGPPRIGALQLVRTILKEEGVAGFYRGFGVSVATFVPSSAVWWSAYGTYQKVIWGLIHKVEDAAPTSTALASAPPAPAASSAVELEPAVTHSTAAVMAVQTTSSVMAGCTSSLATTPLDLIKTRIQVAYKHHGAPPSFVEVSKQILREDGPSGFLRGAVPRMISASLWGTCMVTVYEFLKRVCQTDGQE